MLKNNNKYFVRIYLICTIFLCALNISAQNFKDPMIGVTNRIYVQYTDSIVETYYYRGEKNIKLNDELFYFWYAARDIKRTRGAFEGKLLHGKYAMFYYNKDLLSKGQFKYGLKDGEWKSWYQGGEIKSKEKWHKGKIVGVAYYYNSKGIIQKKRKYTDTKGGLIVSSYNTQGGITSVEYYKKNTLVKTDNYQLNAKGKYEVVKPEKAKKNKVKNKKAKTKVTKEAKPKEKKSNDGKKSKSKTPKIKIQKYRQVVPGGAGA